MKTGTNPYSWSYSTPRQGPDPNQPTYGSEEGGCELGEFVRGFWSVTEFTGSKHDCCVTAMPPTSTTSPELSPSENNRTVMAVMASHLFIHFSSRLVAKETVIIHVEQ